jgi:uncharacterized membrane protein YkoI
MLHFITVQLIFVAVATSLLLFALVVGHTFAEETVPAKSRASVIERVSVIEIVERLENAGYGPFNSLSRDSGKWEVEVQKNGKFIELTVDPASGKVISEYRDDAELAPAKDDLPLSKLLQKLSQKVGFDDLDEISFEQRYWEVEVHQDGQKRELRINPLSAEVISTRIDH